MLRESTVNYLLLEVKQSLLHLVLCRLREGMVLELVEWDGEELGAHVHGGNESNWVPDTAVYRKELWQPSHSKPFKNMAEFKGRTFRNQNVHNGPLQCQSRLAGPRVFEWIWVWTVSGYLLPSHSCNSLNQPIRNGLLKCSQPFQFQWKTFLERSLKPVFNIGSKL